MERKNYEDGLMDGRAKLLLELVTEGVITKEYANYKLNTILETSENKEVFEKYQQDKYAVFKVGGRPTGGNTGRNRIRISRKIQNNDLR